MPVVVCMFNCCAFYVLPITVRILNHWKNYAVSVACLNAWILIYIKGKQHVDIKLFKILHLIDGCIVDNHTALPRT